MGCDGLEGVSVDSLGFEGFPEDRGQYFLLSEFFRFLLLRSTRQMNVYISIPKGSGLEMALHFTTGVSRSAQQIDQVMLYYSF